MNNKRKIKIILTENQVQIFSIPIFIINFLLFYYLLKNNVNLILVCLLALCVDLIICYICDIIKNRGG